MKITVWTYEGLDRLDRAFAWLTGGGVLWTVYDHEGGELIAQGWARTPEKAVRKAKRSVGIYQSYPVEVLYKKVQR